MKIGTYQHDHLFTSVHICTLQSKTFELQFDIQNKLRAQWNDNFHVVNYLSNSNFNLQFISAFISACLRTSRYVDKRLQFPILQEQYEGIKNECNYGREMRNASLLCMLCLPCSQLRHLQMFLIHSISRDKGRR